VIDVGTVLNFTIAVAVGRFVSDLAFQHYLEWTGRDSARTRGRADRQ
jgi:hypothetical protein